MEPMKNVKDAERIRDKMLLNYTTKNNTRIDEGFQTDSESKRELDKMKGYASVDFLIKKENRDAIVGEIRDFLDENKEEIEKAQVFPQYGVSTYVDDPDTYEIVEFALELNKGDYDTLRRAISNSEEDAMRNHKTPKDLYEEEMKEEQRVGRRHY